MSDQVKKLSNETICRAVNEITGDREAGCGAAEILKFLRQPTGTEYDQELRMRLVKLERQNVLVRVARGEYKVSDRYLQHGPGRRKEALDLHEREAIPWLVEQGGYVRKARFREFLGFGPARNKLREQKARKRRTKPSIPFDARSTYHTTDDGADHRFTARMQALASSKLIRGDFQDRHYMNLAYPLMDAIPMAGHTARATMWFGLRRVIDKSDHWKFIDDLSAKNRDRVLRMWFGQVGAMVRLVLEMQDRFLSDLLEDPSLGKLIREAADGEGQVLRTYRKGLSQYLANPDSKPDGALGHVPKPFREATSLDDWPLVFTILWLDGDPAICEHIGVPIWEALGALLEVDPVALSRGMLRHPDPHGQTLEGFLYQPLREAPEWDFMDDGDEPHSP